MHLFIWLCIVALAAGGHVTRFKRQLNWNGRDFNFDHVPMSADAAIVISADPSHLTIPGEPGVDYPVLPSIPLTHFHCRGQVPGYYGDTETACQVFHVCEMNGRQDSFLCPNGTIFSQKSFSCDWWYNVQCDSTESHYRLNRNLFQGSDIGLYGSNSFWNWVHEAEQLYTSSRERFEKSRSKQKVPVATTPIEEAPEPLGELFDSQEAVLPPVANPIAPQGDREARRIPQNPKLVPVAEPLVASAPVTQLFSLTSQVPVVQPTPTAQQVPVVQSTSTVKKVPVVQSTPVVKQTPVAHQVPVLPFAWDDQGPRHVEHAADMPLPAVEDIDFSPELSWEDLRPSGPLMGPGQSANFNFPILAPVEPPKAKVKPQAVKVTKPEVKVTPQASAVQVREIRPTGKKIAASAATVQKVKPSVSAAVHDTPQAVGYQHFQLGVTAPASATTFGPAAVPVAQTTVAPSIAVPSKVAAPAALTTKRPVVPPVDLDDDYYDDYEDGDYYDELEEEDEFQGQLYPPVPLAVLNQYNAALGLPKTPPKAAKPSKLPLKVVPQKPIKPTQAKPVVSKVKVPVAKAPSAIVESIAQHVQPAQQVATTPRQPVVVQQPQPAPPVEEIPEPVQSVFTTPRQPAVVQPQTPSSAEVPQHSTEVQLPETTTSDVYFSPLPSLKMKKPATQLPYTDVSQLPLAMVEKPVPPSFVPQIPQLPTNYEALTDVKPLRSVAAPAASLKLRTKSASSKAKSTTPKLKTTTVASIPPAAPSILQEPATARTPAAVSSTTPVLPVSTTTLKASLKAKQSSRNLKMRTSTAAAAPSSTIRSVPVASSTPLAPVTVTQEREVATDRYASSTESFRPVVSTMKHKLSSSSLKIKSTSAPPAVKIQPAQFVPSVPISTTENIKISSTTPKVAAQKSVRRSKSKNLRKSTRVAAHSAVEPAQSGSFVTIVSEEPQAPPVAQVPQSPPSLPANPPGFEGLNRRRYVRLNNPVWSIENWESTKV